MQKKQLVFKWVLIVAKLVLSGTKCRFNLLHSFIKFRVYVPVDGDKRCSQIAEKSIIGNEIDRPPYVCYCNGETSLLLQFLCCNE